MSDLIIFDLDGVITSEEAYWDAAGLTLHEISYSQRLWNLDERELGSDGCYQPVKTADESRRLSRATLPVSEILAYKARALNTNWDTCYAAVCLRLIDLLAHISDLSSLLPLRPWDDAWLSIFREYISCCGGGIYDARIGQGQAQSIAPPHDSSEFDPALQSAMPAEILDLPVFQGYTGLDLINRFDVYAGETLGYPIDNVFSRHSPYWAYCRDIFQEWYLGDELYAQTYGRAPAQPDKPGCIHFEQPLLPVERIRKTLDILRDEGYTLGFATGRVRQEAFYPLERYGLLSYFDKEHICTYDDVERAEAELRKRGDQTLLGKPHPFQFLVAAKGSEQFIVIGDSASDIIGGRDAGAITVSVQTGVGSSEAQKQADFGVEDVTKLPGLVWFIDSLETIQRLQFSQREKAERLLRRWFARHMHLTVEGVTLAPKAVSLNSFNGFYRLDGKEYFFKTHVEAQGSISEYYHAEVLQQAGYNIVMPLQTIHEEGQQMVTYPVIRWPVMFDLMRAIETGNAPDGAQETVISAEERECERLLEIYASTLVYSTAEEHAQAPIHQLFWHRLTGERFKNFYTGKLVFLPEQPARDARDSIAFSDLLGYYWNINGRTIKSGNEPITLRALIEEATAALQPERAAMTVIGHGDAHFGNVFLEDNTRYLYFDPAFAGRHTPLLDITKPLFHNVFATWMYFPREVAQDLQLTVALRDSTIYLEHNYTLSPVRQAILLTKLTRLLAPLVAMLRSCEALPDDWRAIVRGALLCCPLLTINLLDYSRLPVEISWLGLSQVMEVGTFDLF